MGLLIRVASGGMNWWRLCKSAPAHSILFAIALHEDFVNVVNIAVASGVTFEPLATFSFKFDASQTDDFVADCDTVLGQRIFDITVAQIEAIVEPDRITDDFGWESVAFVGIHSPILSISRS